ncbi:MAG: hypothetical protein JOZ97_00260 [Candidatus Eremiobacteraeota bacterium]|nr:hypothetical protein [Candidatus Eremiobacteraeota bacterium]
MITITADPFTVAHISAGPNRPADFRSDGTDTYEIMNDDGGALDITLLSLRPAFPPAIVAVLLLLAAIAAFWALAQLSGRGRLTIQCEPLTLTLIAATSFALFLLVPRYLHNDTVGGGLRWGYLAWGYVDSVSAIPHAFASSGLTGLANMPSNLKPIIYPLLASLFTAFGSPLSVSIVISAFMTALATAGIAQLGLMLLDRWAGLFAAALFALSPVTLSYATAFYAETAFLAGLVWAAILIINGLRSSSRTSLLLGAIIGALAVACKTLDAAVLYAVALLLVLLAARLAWKAALSVALVSGFAAVIVAILAWPFLWTDSLTRIRLALVGRVLFDKYAQVSASLLDRLFTIISQTIAHTDPLTVSMFTGGIFWAAARRDRSALWLALGVLGGMLFVLPTAQYFQHYWFYVVPFLELLAAFPLMFLSSRLRAPLFAVVAAATFAWSALYFPYPAMATIGCSNFDCSARRWGVSEPVYGLAEAARWIRENVSPRALIGTLVAPHVLQMELPGYRVANLYIPEDAAGQVHAVRIARIEYLVTNSWSEHVFGESVAAPQIRRVWASSRRSGSATVYRIVDARERLDLLDAPPPSEVGRLAGDVQRIAVYPKTSSYAALSNARYIVVLSETRYPLRNFTSLLKLGGGTLVLRRTARWPSVLAYERPLHQTVDAAAFALPTLSALRRAQQVRLNTTVRGRGDAMRTIFAGTIVPHSAAGAPANVLSIDLTTSRRNALPEDFVMYASCLRRSTVLHALPITATETRGYETSGSALGRCMSGRLPIGAYVVVRGDVHRDVRATLKLSSGN